VFCHRTLNSHVFIIHIHIHTHTHTHIYIYIYIYTHTCIYLREFRLHYKKKILFSVFEKLPVRQNCLKCQEKPSERSFVHNILVAPKCTVPKSGWIPWNDRIISSNEVQINSRAVVIIYFELVFRCSIETKSVKSRQRADNNPACKMYLLKEVQSLGHEIKLHTYIYIYMSVCMNI